MDTLNTRRVQSDDIATMSSFIQWFNNPHKITAYNIYLKQELSYRQQIARQLRTQYTEGIYRHKINITP